MTNIIFLEFVNSRPFSAVDEKGNSWDIEYCERYDEYYADNSGSGRGFYLESEDSVYWTKDKDALVKYGNGDSIPHSQRIELPEEFGEDMEEWATLNVFCGYCETCDDWLPRDSLCEHLVVCCECGEIHNRDSNCD